MDFLLHQWAFFGLLAAVLSSAMMLLQEQFKVDGYVQACWNKVMCVLVMLPFVLARGLPDNPAFYILLALSSVMYAISDVVFYRGVASEGAATVSRLLPGAMILSFLLWFVVDPALLLHYAQKPKLALGIFLVLCASAWFAGHIKKCTVSMAALRRMWFVFFAATLGSVLTKAITNQAPIAQGPAAYIFVQALMMLGLWCVYFYVRRPVPGRAFYNPKIILPAMAIGIITACAVAANLYAVYNVDNPAYIPAVKYLDVFMILGVYALIGRKASGNVWSGVGVVVCAAALVLLKTRL